MRKKGKIEKEKREIWWQGGLYWICNSLSLLLRKYSKCIRDNEPQNSSCNLTLI
jgi:hypothetical protein